MVVSGDASRERADRRTIRFVAGPRLIDPPIRLASVIALAILVLDFPVTAFSTGSVLQLLSVSGVLIAFFRPTLGLTVAVAAAAVELLIRADSGTLVACAVAVAISLSHFHWKAVCTGLSAIALISAAHVLTHNIPADALVAAELRFLVLALVLGAGAGAAQAAVKSAISRARQSEKQAAAERLALASDVHDLVTFHVSREATIITRLIGSVGDKSVRDELAILRLVNQDAQRALRQVVANTRIRSHIHRSSAPLHAAQLEADLAAAFEGSDVEARISIQLPDGVVSPRTLHHLECILTEVAANIIRHSSTDSGTHAQITVVPLRDGQITLDARNPCRHDAETASPHSLNSRIRRLGGTCEASSDGETFTFTAVIPFTVSSVGDAGEPSSAPARDAADRAVETPHGSHESDGEPHELDGEVHQ
ncbi:hypothetical protein [Brevibacterium otitidis]|uniref:Signal transduction histidine kinase n=1 Tax=Brevibacterium otitidis TaxID=53364 RepID=A0ABV5X1H0_9MICO|nr:hypothetical protein GCM10023233_07170 [Brevibacterium otitidis]